MFDGADPSITYDLGQRADRIRVYEQVLREGTEDDVRFYVDVEPNVVLCTFAKILLIDADAVGSLLEVVGDRRIATSNVERQLAHARCLHHRRIVDILWDRDWAGGRSEPWIASPRHIYIVRPSSPSSRGSSVQTPDRQIAVR